MRRTKAQIAAARLLADQTHIVGCAFQTLADACAFAELSPPILAMTIRERMALASLCPSLRVVKADSHGTIVELCGVQIIERKSNG